MLALGYCRISRGDGEALTSYNHRLADFCRQHGYEIAATFLDNDSDLHGYYQLLAYLRRPARPFTVVVLPSPHTLGHNPFEVMRAYFELDCLGAKVECMDGTTDVTLAVLAAGAIAKDGQGRGEKVREAMRRKAVKGEVLGRPPYGYKAGPRRRLVVVPDEATVVRYIFRLYLKDTLGIRLIARRLNAEEFHTRQGRLWSMVSVRDILRNRVYVGTYSRLGVRIPSSHQAIISHEDFRRVQGRLNAHRPKTDNRQTTPFLLSGLVYCGACGSKMTGVSRKQRWQRRSDGAQRTALYRYYQCQARTNQSICAYHTRRAEDLEEMVREALLGRGGELIEAVSQPDDEALQKEARDRHQRLQARLHRLDKRLEDCVYAATAGRINYEGLQKMGAKIAAQRLALLDNLTEAQRQIDLQAAAARQRGQRSQALAQLSEEWYYLTPTQRQTVLKQLLERITVTDDGIQLFLSP